MANVYVVTTKRFFTIGGIEYSGAVDFTDIRTFSNADKAEEYAQMLIDNINKVYPNDCPKFEVYDYTKEEMKNYYIYKEYKVYTQNTPNKQGVRYGIMIVKQKVE
jgi:hypothetical protein